jgi:hypothetical protein
VITGDSTTARAAPGSTSDRALGRGDTAPPRPSLANREARRGVTDALGVLASTPAILVIDDTVRWENLDVNGRQIATGTALGAVSTPKRTDFTTGEVLGRVRGTQSQAECGWADLTGQPNPMRQWNGLKSMVTAGRSVTFVLQKLRSREASFEAWYAPLQIKMRADPLLQYICGLRNSIEKEGMPRPVFATIEFSSDGAVVGNAEVSVGEDEFGLWVAGAAGGAPHLDSSRAEALATAPCRFTNFRLPNPPGEHLGRPLPQTNVENLGRLYLDYLDARIVVPAFETFGTAGG